MGEEMREIKFKIWDKKNKRWYIQYPNCNNLFNVYKNGTLGRKFEDDDYIFVQYTGLKDKNGKEIYVGDIVKIFTVTGGKFQDERRLEEIHWWNSGFCRGIKDVQGLPLWWLDKDTQKFEVVGNIYENPELLKEKK